MDVSIVYVISERTRARHRFKYCITFHWRHHSVCNQTTFRTNKALEKRYSIDNWIFSILNTHSVLNTCSEYDWVLFWDKTALSHRYRHTRTREYAVCNVTANWRVIMQAQSENNLYLCGRNTRCQANYDSSVKLQTRVSKPVSSNHLSCQLHVSVTLHTV